MVPFPGKIVAAINESDAKAAESVFTGKQTHALKRGLGDLPYCLQCKSEKRKSSILIAYSRPHAIPNGQIGRLRSIIPLAK